MTDRQTDVLQKLLELLFAPKNDPHLGEKLKVLVHQGEVGLQHKPGVEELVM